MMHDLVRSYNQARTCPTHRPAETVFESPMQLSHTIPFTHVDLRSPTMTGETAGLG